MVDTRIRSGINVSRKPDPDAFPRVKLWFALALALAFSVLLMTDVARETPSDPGVRRTDPIRENLSRLRKVLLSVERNLDTLHDVSESQQIQFMHDTVGVLKDYLLPYLAAKEAVLYPAVDRQFPGSHASFTQTMRQEHLIMRRWIEEMQEIADDSMPDHNAFARKGERLLGLIEAHFEVEESVLLPLLDRPIRPGLPDASATAATHR